MATLIQSQRRRLRIEHLRSQLRRIDRRIAYHVRKRTPLIEELQGLLFERSRDRAEALARGQEQRELDDIDEIADALQLMVFRGLHRRP